jgi:nitrite reductase (NO-forming)
MKFVPSEIDVPAGDRLVLEVVNTDNQLHDLVLETGADSGRLAPGESTTVDVGVVGRGLDGWCSLVGHRQMGMTLQINVTEPGHDHHASGPAEPASDHEALDAELPPLEDDGPQTHRVTMTVGEVEREVAPGITQRLWTYNGRAPGPVLHGRVGDRFVVTLVNDGTIGHSIDFHAGALAPDRPMRTLEPGQSLTYRFTAERAGVWMYHCSTMPMSVHIANGMFGAVIIDPPGLTPVDREYVLVQSEYYLGPQNGEVDAAKVATQKPDLVVFNGYADQYRYAPLTAKVGERVRIWVLDAGPNLSSSFHIVGGQFDTVFSEGDYRLRNGGSTGTGGSQALALQPAQGGFVEFTLPEAGNYSFVTHAMSNAEKGAAGTIRVTK